MPLTCLAIRINSRRVASRSAHLRMCVSASGKGAAESASVGQSMEKISR